jgi:hypothetical protein
LGLPRPRAVGRPRARRRGPGSFARLPRPPTTEPFAGPALEALPGELAAAEGDDVTADALLFAALEHFRVETIKLKAEADTVARDLDYMRRERLLATGPETDRIARYESHLSRRLDQALHELHRLQATRAGEPVAPPIVVDVTLSADEGG